MKLHRYHATIRGSKLPKVAAISSVFHCHSATLWCESSTKVRKFLFAKLLDLVFSLSRKVSFSYLGFIAVKSLSQDLRPIVKLQSPIVI